jgi:hypothetical protein
LDVDARSAAAVRSEAEDERRLPRAQRRFGAERPKGGPEGVSAQRE